LRRSQGFDVTTLDFFNHLLAVQPVLGRFSIENPPLSAYHDSRMTNYEARFGGIKRLYGAEAQERLRLAHVCVVGIGGVGSWAVEALARTGVGNLTLVDFDDVCITNVNRQLHGVTGEFGKPKISVMAGRIKLINPDCVIHERQMLFTATTAEEILATRFDALLDAIDSPSMKALMIAACVHRGIPVVTTGGAGGRRDPTALRCSDLSLATHDRLLAVTRKLLRGEYSFPRDLKATFGVPCVFSPEPQVFPAGDGTVCEKREVDSSLRLDCRSGYGTATFVTGAFGFAAAAQVVNIIAGPPPRTV
jgi:tRNA A37 threonylcarbamoyladenosine dehydratase